MGKPCDIVGCVVDGRVVKSESPAFDACVIPDLRMRPASEHIVGRISELCHIVAGCLPISAIVALIVIKNIIPALLRENITAKLQLRGLHLL